LFFESSDYQTIKEWLKGKIQYMNDENKKRAARFFEEV